MPDRARYCFGGLIAVVLFAAAVRFGMTPEPSARPQSELAPSAPAPPIASPSAPERTNRAPATEAELLLRRLEPLSLTDKPRALTLALAGDSHLPAHGVLAEARRALIVTLMVDLQRLPEARARARQFTRQHPESRYLPLVQGVSGIHPRPRPSELRDASARLSR